MVAFVFLWFFKTKDKKLEKKLQKLRSKTTFYWSEMAVRLKHFNYKSCIEILHHQKRELVQTFLVNIMPPSQRSVCSFDPMNLLTVTTLHEGQLAFLAMFHMCIHHRKICHNMVEVRTQKVIVEGTNEQMSEWHTVWCLCMKLML